MSDNSAGAFDEYLRPFPDNVRARMEQIFDLVRRIAPDAREKISYGMPTFHLNGVLVHIAAYERHIGFYPTPTGVSTFEEELSGYKHAKGSVQFPLDRPLPMDLIGRIVEFRAKENRTKSE